VAYIYGVMIKNNGVYGRGSTNNHTSYISIILSIMLSITVTITIAVGIIIGVISVLISM